MKSFLKLKFLLVFIVLVASILRLYKLSVNPPSLFGDELDLGYQAYSILKTGHDYQGNFMPIHFHSIAEWRTPLYLYSAVPTIALFGITPLGVRLPAALFGILSVLLICLFVKELLTYGQPPENHHPRAVLAAALMAISPWSLQYSRAGFEVTEMLFFLLLGLWLFFKALKIPSLLWTAVLCVVLTAWVYSTAKFFTPLLLIFLFIVFRKEILRMPRKNLVSAVVAGLIVGIPITFSTIFGGGTQRINDISILTDPLMEQTVDTGRGLDQKVGTPAIESKLLNNKFVYYGGEIVNNYFQSISTDFLFLKGDINLRQSIGTGELYLIEIIPLVAGLAFFFFEKGRDLKVKLLMGFWILAASVPSSLTLGGGTHATRLILMLPPLIFFVSFGWVGLYRLILDKYTKLFIVVSITSYLISLVFYFHNYYAVYPTKSMAWWHYGWSPAVQELKSINSNYDRVIISMSGEPAWIFFAANYEYPPDLWQKEFPIGRDVTIPGFGKISHTGKYYFGSPQKDIQIYGLGKYIDSKTLYLANAKEDGENLIIHPDKVPSGLKLIKAIPFPSGEPAFYLFSGI